MEKDGDLKWVGDNTKLNLKLHKEHCEHLVSVAEYPKLPCLKFKGKLRVLSRQFVRH